MTCSQIRCSRTLYFLKSLIVSGFSAKMSLNTEIILVILALFSPQPRSCMVTISDRDNRILHKLMCINPGI